MSAELLADLARVKVLFQLRSIALVIGIPDTPEAKLQRIVEANRQSFATQDYAKRRAAALKGRKS